MIVMVIIAILAAIAIPVVPAVRDSREPQRGENGAAVLWRARSSAASRATTVTRTTSGDRRLHRRTSHRTRTTATTRSAATDGSPASDTTGFTLIATPQGGQTADTAAASFGWISSTRADRSRAPSRWGSAGVNSRRAGHFPRLLYERPAAGFLAVRHTSATLSQSRGDALHSPRPIILGSRPLIG